MMILVTGTPGAPATIHNNRTKRFPDSTRSRPIDFSVPEAWISRRSSAAPHVHARTDGESLSWEKSLNHHNRKTWTHCQWSLWSTTPRRTLWRPSRWLVAPSSPGPRTAGLTRRQTPSAPSSSTPARWWRSARGSPGSTWGPAWRTAGATWW